MTFILLQKLPTEMRFVFVDSIHTIQSSAHK
jgi:hypothetical protein